MLVNNLISTELEHTGLLTGFARKALADKAATADGLHKVLETTSRLGRLARTGSKRIDGVITALAALERDAMIPSTVRLINTYVLARPPAVGSVLVALGVLLPFLVIIITVTMMAGRVHGVLDVGATSEAHRALREALAAAEFNALAFDNAFGARRRDNSVVVFIIAVVAAVMVHVVAGGGADVMAVRCGLLGGVVRDGEERLADGGRLRDGQYEEGEEEDGTSHSGRWSVCSGWFLVVHSECDVLKYK